MFEEWGLGTACENIATAWDNHGDIVVGNDVWIGYEAVILAGVTIGDGAIIGSRFVALLDQYGSATEALDHLREELKK